MHQKVCAMEIKSDIYRNARRQNSIHFPGNFPMRTQNVMYVGSEPEFSVLEIQALSYCAVYISHE